MDSIFPSDRASNKLGVAQGTFIVYKARRAGVPVVFVDPAYPGSAANRPVWDRFGVMLQVSVLSLVSHPESA
jgi:hypothetical protein